MQGMNVRSVPTAYVSGSTTFYAIPVEGAWSGCPGGDDQRRGDDGASPSRRAAASSRRCLVRALQLGAKGGRRGLPQRRPRRPRPHLHQHRRLVGRAGLVHGRGHSVGGRRRRERHPRLTGAPTATAASCASGPLPSPSGATSSWPPTASSAPGRRTERQGRDVRGEAAIDSFDDSSPAPGEWVCARGRRREP